MKRNPKISFRTSEGVTNASACVSEKDIRKWFQEISEFIENVGLTEVIQDPARVFNADETGFNVCPKTGKVLAEKGSKNVYHVEKGSAKENITVMFTFSAAGQACKPMIIYPYIRIPDRVSFSVPSGWGIGRSEKGWMTATVFQDFIEQCFYPQLMADGIPLPIILFVDGHKTHLTMEVSQVCRNLQIHLIALYPNATRILQPADVAAFHPIKVGWKKGLREWYAANNYCTNLNKESFAPLLKTVLDATAKPATLVNGFRVTGLCPFNANNVDYSKCIASSKDNQQQQAMPVAETEGENSSCVLTYPEFCNIVGDTILEQCFTATVLTLQKSDENFNAIYKLWKKFNAFTDEDNLEIALSNQDNQFLNYGTDDPSLMRNNNDTPSCFLDEFTGDLIIPEQEKTYAQESFMLPMIENDVEKIQLVGQSIIPVIDSQSLAETNKKEENKSILEKKREELAFSDNKGSVNVIKDFDEKMFTEEKNIVNAEKGKKIQDYNLQIEATSCSTVFKNLENEKVEIVTKTEENTSNTEMLCCSTAAKNPRMNLSRGIHPNRQITVILNEPLTEYLKKQIRPIAPKRQGKRESEKLPFALTSDSYVEIIKAKQLKKQEEEAAKEIRKRLREDKKKQKENAANKQENKRNKRQKNKIKQTSLNPILSRSPAKKPSESNEPICCDVCLSPITRRIIDCSQCNKHFHFNCIPLSHRVHIPEDNDDDAFLCHFCYKESNSDLSFNDDDEDEDVLFASILQASKKQKFQASRLLKAKNR